MSAFAQKAVTFTLFVSIVGVLGLGYCHLAYSNGVDILKDGTLIGVISAVTAAFMKFTGGD